jgi:hypothetical protein
MPAYRSGRNARHAAHQHIRLTTLRGAAPAAERALLPARCGGPDTLALGRSRWEDDPPRGLFHMRAVLLPDVNVDDDAEDAERAAGRLSPRSR